MKCGKCQGPSSSFKCAVCGAKAEEHDPNHKHEEFDGYCMPNCDACDKAAVHCDCK